MSGMMEGMVFGAGSSLGHRAIDAVMGPRSMSVEHVNQPVASSSSELGMAPACGNQLRIVYFFFAWLLRFRSSTLESLFPLLLTQLRRVSAVHEGQ